ARDVLHIYRKRRPGQLRDVSWLAPVLTRLRDLGDYEAALLMKAKIEACLAFHTTSDFPLLLSAAANKMLLAAYQPAQPSYRQIFLRRDFRDFKPHRHLRVGDFPTLLPLLENGEIQAGTMSESQEIVLLQTFARRIRVTRPMLVNDDLGAFTDFASMIGRRVADFENATAYGLLGSANGDGPTLNAPMESFFAALKRELVEGTEYATRDDARTDVFVYIKSF
uniref:phage major capsid protein n=1 Tax=Falsiroseomonas sp. TaxID=2870721 RepID=UPI0038D073B0